MSELQRVMVFTALVVAAQLVGFWFRYWLWPKMIDPNKKLRFSFGGWYFEDVEERASATREHTPNAHLD